MDDGQQIRSRLRQMKLGVQDAAHRLRRCRAELQVARDRLADLEDHNWALLSLYDADKAFQEVVETFREFEESEQIETHLDDLVAGRSKANGKEEEKVECEPDSDTNENATLSIDDDDEKSAKRSDVKK